MERGRKKGQRKWNLISLIFQGNQSALERSSYGERYKSSYGERYTSLSIVYWLFVRIIGFKILLFPIIDSLGNPLKFYRLYSQKPCNKLFMHVQHVHIVIMWHGGVKLDLREVICFIENLKILISNDLKVWKTCILNISVKFGFNFSHVS